jgi:hypothetical protein
VVLFESLDFIYMPAPDLGAALRYYVETLGAETEWRIRAFGTEVSRVRLARSGPALLLAGHLKGETPILIFRVVDYRQSVAALRAAGLDVAEVEIPHGPCTVFQTEGGQRLAIYQLLRPEADEHLSRSGKSR